ncbi:fungal specific transcription factor domain-containing protein [Aspergillus ibericus CBS 121593]|uniref:Xylanolytic transcriptional activator regulatory domain-containing protein n=1 Tax=Aspergillus ibericus CBS 121593 TaxID=1448316 RepID=A0A395GQ97_9EURO|nr:hypothetical protein BO80DRAFT_191298 [Aspergillus ibericus CBS 121593]RAK97544.1 hypothetical protein BO80DRAFT_191298 [Aspergillus ibericus CBS 121593]
MPGRSRAISKIMHQSQVTLVGAGTANINHLPALENPNASSRPSDNRLRALDRNNDCSTQSDGDSTDLEIIFFEGDGPSATQDTQRKDGRSKAPGASKSRPPSKQKSPAGNQIRITAMGITSDGPFAESESEDEFFGDSSVASFLKQIKESAKEPGPAEPTNTILHASSSTCPTSWPTVAEAPNSRDEKHDLPPQQLAGYLLNCYFDKIHSLYPFVHKPSFLRMYRNLWTPEAWLIPSSGMGLGDPSVSSSMFHCALNIIFALGCQFSKLDHTAREATSEEFFQRSQSLLNVISLDKGDLALVQTLLLTSQYLQGGKSPSRCWNIIGLACRVAQSLGMHSLKADKNRTPAQIQMRRRVWHGCVMLDLASSMMLGRPPMTHASAVPLPEAVNDEHLGSSVEHDRSEPETLSRTEFYVRTLQLYKILRRILSEVYEPWEDSGQSERIKSSNNQAQILLDLEEELSVFETSLPAALQWNDAHGSAGLAEPFRRESSLLRGRFLHLRILLLRPTLVKFCRENCPPRHPDNSSAGAEPKRNIISDLSLSCSISCVAAAIELSHLMNVISRTELASVWWYSVFYTFTAGVVLVLAQTCPAMESIFSKEVLRVAWESCFNCLANMDSYSNTAKNCASSLQKILCHLLDEGDRESCPLDNTAEQVPAPPTSVPVGHDTPLSVIPTSFPTLSEADVGANQEPPAGFPSEALGPFWNGQDFDGSLMDMLWDDLWLTSPSFL